MVCWTENLLEVVDSRNCARPHPPIPLRVLSVCTRWHCVGSCTPGYMSALRVGSIKDQADLNEWDKHVRRLLKRARFNTMVHVLANIAWRELEKSAPGLRNKVKCPFIDVTGQYDTPSSIMYDVNRRFFKIFFYDL